MPTAYIALGSNLDNRAQTLSLAVERLQGLGTVVARSSLYETEPVGYQDQGRFLNAVVVLETSLAPVPLLRGMLAIEQGLGRDRTGGVPKGPRTLDLDLLMMDELTWSSAELELPHPAMTQRRFVLAPLAEVAGAVRPPGSQQTIAELLACLPAEGEQGAAAVKRLPDPW